MKPQELSERLKKVASYIPEGSRLADIGSDHAKLPCYALERGLIITAVAGEVNEGPLNAAHRNIRAKGMEESIHAKLGDGLQVLDGETVDVITIAGMGGPLIVRILEDGKKRLGASVQRLILQPNVASDHVRKWLYDNQWSLIDEQILEEDGHIYEILVAARSEAPEAVYNKHELEKEMWLGPFLMKQKNSAFELKWSKEREQLKKVKEQLSKGGNTAALTEKKKKIDQYLIWLEEELS
ncbi:tRNA (adenine(22)-N(1))-methyltransferase TrmK [Bacillus sp. H-16]|uniref:tRNA (adenine(22)-N(1))-methyltransferase n=1 Tax=Alteribacter salitolerans TaxID=2912333 RepID=UPI00196600C2|nr:class I SAM-dependent methyltransferase [Alteribacter salitolerans]MBM7097087.1 tRNA (adenine(22)-N(1))-methyltransferase TrmK [Alteribacter salitolerans]